VTIVKMFTAAVMCISGILIAVCYCCCLRDVKYPNELSIADLGEKTFDECIENEESATPAGEDVLAQKTSFENECCTVEDETRSSNKQPENSARF